MGKSGGSGGSSSTVTSRYAPYIETKHETFLNNSETYGDLLRVDTASPYADFTDFDFGDALYGSGYTIASFPSLYDMYGKFIGGLDIEALFDEIVGDVQDADSITAAVNAHRDLIDDDVDDAKTRFQVGMRDINAVMTSSFVVGNSVIEEGGTKKVAEMSADMRYKLIPVAAEVFAKHLAWNQQTIATYLTVMKMAIGTETEQSQFNYKMDQLDTIWPFYVMEYERANLGALQGAVTRKEQDQGAESSTGANILGGASMGASVGGVPGAIIGGLAGWLFS